MRPLSIRASLTAWFVGLTALLLAAFALVLHEGLGRALRAGLDARLRTEAAGLAALCDWDEERGAAELEGSEALAAQLAAAHPERSQEVWTWPELRPLHRAGAVAELPPPERALGEGFDPERGPRAAHATVALASGRRRACTLLARCVPSPGEEAWGRSFLVLARVSEDLAPVEAQLARLRWFLGATAAVAMALVLGFGVFLSRRVVAPLRALGAAAAEIHAGRAARLPRRGTGDEVDQLGDHLAQAFARLQEALERQARFTSDAAHELRNPISALRSAAEVALRRERAPEEYRRFLAEILATTRRMGEAVEALLLLARLDAGQAGAGFREVDLAALAREAAAAQPGADGRVAVLADAPVLVRGDAALLRVLVGNLVGNALRHSGPGTPVRVRVEARGRPELRVEDQGPGIPPEALGRVFDRFFRVESSGEDVPGAGLGLAIVAEVARLHGAEPRIDSTPSGTTVTVRF